MLGGIVHEFLMPYYASLKALHLIFVISWMAGLLYLPRLFVYHTQTLEEGGDGSVFKVMEQKLYKIIMTPALIGSFLLGGLLIVAGGPYLMHFPWLHAKLFLVLCLAAYQGYCGGVIKKLSKNQRPHSSKFFRYFNEIPALLMIVIVFLVVLKP